MVKNIINENRLHDLWDSNGEDLTRTGINQGEYKLRGTNEEVIAAVADRVKTGVKQRNNWE